MQVVENDLRKIDHQQWLEIQELQHRVAGHSNPLSSEIADALEMLMRECRRLRTLSEFKALEGFNAGYDEGYADGKHDTEIFNSMSPF